MVYLSDVQWKVIGVGVQVFRSALSAGKTAMETKKLSVVV